MAAVTSAVGETTVGNGVAASGGGSTRLGPEEYIRERLDPEIAWYNGRSAASRRWFQGLRIIELILAASIPFLVGGIDESSHVLKVAAGLAGVVVATISGLIGLTKHQEKWVQYRSVCESLLHHKWRYLTGAEPYKGDNAFQELVNNVEALISQENTNWSQYIKADKPEQSGS